MSMKNRQPVPYVSSSFIFLFYLTHLRPCSVPPLYVSSPFLSLLSPPQLLLNTDLPSCQYLPQPSSFAPSSPSAEPVPYLCPHPSISALFCFEGAGGQSVIRISFLCCLTHSFLSSLCTLSLWYFYLPLFKGCPSPDEGLVWGKGLKWKGRSRDGEGIERKRSGEKTCRGGPWGIVVHTVCSHHYKLESVSQPLPGIISLHTVLLTLWYAAGAEMN